MKSEPYKCNICGMVFINSKQLAKHQLVVHIDNMYQCQSCDQVFNNKEDFEKHTIEIHSKKHCITSCLGSDSDVSSNHHKRRHYDKNEMNDTESIFLKRKAEEDKARKRTRGPYRKTSSF